MKKVIVYSTPTCHYCTLAKDYLKQNNIDFEEKNVAEDSKAGEEMFNLTKQMGVPVILVENEFVIGFVVEKIDELLNKK